MYVDKKLRGVKAVQTLSRLNRIQPEKEEGFVLDFVNDAEAMQESFEDYFEMKITETTDPTELYVAHGYLTGFRVIDEDEARATREFLETLGDPFQQELEELRGSSIE